MPFVNDGGSIVLEPIGIGRPRPNRHENYRMVSCKIKVHASLQAHAFASTHLKIGDDLICHVLFTANAPITSRRFSSRSGELGGWAFTLNHGPLAQI